MEIFNKIKFFKMLLPSKFSFLMIEFFVKAFYLFLFKKDLLFFKFRYKKLAPFSELKGNLILFFLYNCFTSLKVLLVNTIII